MDGVINDVCAGCGQKHATIAIPTDDPNNPLYVHPYCMEAYQQKVLSVWGFGIDISND